MSRLSIDAIDFSNPDKDRDDRYTRPQTAGSKRDSATSKRTSRPNSPSLSKTTSGLPATSSLRSSRTSETPKLKLSKTEPIVTPMSKDLTSPSRASWEYKLMESVESIQSKFIDNMKLVEKLAHDNELMQKKINTLEKAVRKRRPYEETKEVDVDELLRQKLLSTDDILLDKNKSTSDLSQRPKSADPRTLKRAASTERCQLSGRLQADMDKYNQKMEIIKIKEKEKEAEDKEYQLQQRERMLRVS